MEIVQDQILAAFLSQVALFQATWRGRMKHDLKILFLDIVVCRTRAGSRIKAREGRRAAFRRKATVDGIGHSSACWIYRAGPHKRPANPGAVSASGQHALAILRGCVR